MNDKHLSEDQMNNADPVAVGTAAFTVIDALQDRPAHEQVLAMSACFLLVCDRFQVRPSDVFSTVTNVMNGVEGKRPEFAAIQSYLAGEIH